MAFRRHSLSTRIEVFGDTQFDREMQARGRRSVQARPLYDDLGWKLIKIQREQFRTEGARGGAPWAPLEPSTIRAKGHDTIMVDSGATKDSFEYGDTLNIFEATDDDLKWGSRAEGGSYHQPDAKGRRVFALTENDRREIVRDMQHWVIFGELRDV